MSTPTAHDLASGQDNFQSRLETLVLLMQASNEVREMADIGLLEDMVGSLRAGAMEANLPGVSELLRMWTSALHDVSRAGGVPTSDNLLQMTMWFMALQEYVAGRLDAQGREMLAQMPDGIRWLPRSSPAFARAILRKLDRPAASAPDADADAMPAQPIHESRAIATLDAHVAEAAHETDAPNTEIASVGTLSIDDSVCVSHSAAVDVDAFAFASDEGADTPDDAFAFDGRGAGVVPPITPELLAQLPPEFLAAFPPGALDDLPHDVIEALLIETTHAHASGADSGNTSDGDAFVIGNDALPVFAAEAANDELLADVADVFGHEPASDTIADIDRGTEFAFVDPINHSSADSSETVADVAAFDLPTESVETPAAETTASDPPVSDPFASGAFETEMPAFEMPVFEMPALDAPGSDSPIWIGQEELDLTRQAILDQLMPLAQAWADTPDTDANAPILEELAYQSQLVVNVMELIGTATLAHGMNAVRTGIETRDPAVTPEAVATWCSVLLATIEQPNAESGELLGMAAHDLPGLDDAWRAALVAELGRVRIGLDPALIAQRKTLASLEDIGLAPADDVLPSVLDGMLRELPGNASKFGTSVRALADTGAFESIDEARRVAHTLKGDANTVGVRGLANLTHALEDILIELAKRPELLNAECADLLTNASDAVEEIADHLLGRGAAPANLLDTYQHVLDTANALADGAGAVPTPAKTHSPTMPSGQAETSEPPTIGAAPETARPTVTAPQTGMAASGIQSLNVPSALLDDLQRLAGESLVTARQIDRQLDGLSGLHRDQRQEVRYTQELVSRLDDLVALRGAALQSTAQKAGTELDPLEIDQYNELHVISRQLIEAHTDSSEFVRRIERTMSVLADLRSEQEQLNRELQRTILQTRTVPFRQISTRLQRIVRQTSKQVMKPVHLELVGEGIPLDAELLERVVEPLAHLLRNAIDHGIETPERRRDIGKPEEGRITLRVGLQGDAAVIDIQDDGAGLDFDAIRTRAIDAGLLDQAQEADERLLTRLILLPGFSTRSSATEVSGRGIGMDVVNQRIAALRGAMTINSERGAGMRVSLRLPVTQTLANVIVARGQHQVSAVVSASVDRVVSFAQGECAYDAQEGRLWLMMGDARVPALPIEHFYGAAADARMWLDASGVGLQVNDTDGRPTIVLVAGIDEVRSTVVKPISAYLPPIPAVRGITQLGDGGLAPVIDLDLMLQSMQERATGLQAVSITTAAPATRVVVADDSLSVRRALEQLMQDAGFEVETARDGFEALAAIQARPTHALLVDLEMPRMNGLEVTRNLRTHVETRDLPVVMITSRATDKHQAMAEQAGVTRMLGKPFSEDSLVALVRELIASQSEKAQS
jgi:chemotaxis protein histidine kinase CheA/ActR/RegA family two-component response regulator